MGREFELKFQANQEILNTIQAEYGPFSAISMETVYFDTPDADMKRLRWTLRRRLENGRALCSLKTPGDGLCRGEWEWCGTDMEEAIQELCRLGAPIQLTTLTAKGLFITCGAKFTRLAALLTVPGGTVELALDAGCFLGGGREVPFAEVEVELKSGPDTAALAFAQALATRYGLTPETKGKAERAMALI